MTKKPIIGNVVMALGAFWFAMGFSIIFDNFFELREKENDFVLILTLVIQGLGYVEGIPFWVGVLKFFNWWGIGIGLLIVGRGIVTSSKRKTIFGLALTICVISSVAIVSVSGV